jgi:hypothetical protein
MTRGLRLHIAGSAATDCDGELLAVAHSFVRSLVEEIVRRGGGLVLGTGGETVGETGHPCIFDWTALEVVGGLPDPAPEWPADRPDRFVVVASQRALEKIPSWRSEVWDMCRARKDFELELLPSGWRMGGVIRDRQVLRGDILVIVGGGAGVEHLADLYRSEGKPVLPIRAEVGSINRDGNGGSRFLQEQALADVEAFFRLREDAGSATARLSALRLESNTDVGVLTNATLDLLDDLQRPRAFYVRLLAKDHPLFREVEGFFREVVDPLMDERGYARHQVGLDRPEAAFINVEIFEALHRAALVVVDLTGVRPNCMMELGYALGRRRRVVISAKEGTALPFDQDKLPTFMWTRGDLPAQRMAAYRDWLDRYSELPFIVT